MNETTNGPRRKDDVHPMLELTWTEPAPAGAQLADVMIDTETLGTAPGSAILSIGAVMFGPAGLGEEFYAPISLASCTAAGLTIDPGTVAWWMKQSEAARAAAFRDDAEPLAAVLEQFTCWLNLVDAERPWAQGANFDPPLLEAAYRACGMTPPWKYWDVRDTRTLYDLAGVRVDRARGTHHNALDDARAQAEAAVVALQRLQDVHGQQTVASAPGAAPTDMSRRLREAATAEVSYADARLLIGAAEEIERYYGGMMAWKKTAEKKDADWNAERMGRVNDRIEARSAAADEGGSDAPLYSTRQDAERWRTMVRLTLADTMVDLVETEIAKRPNREGMTGEQLQQEMVDCLTAAVDAERNRAAAVGVGGQND